MGTMPEKMRADMAFNDPMMGVALLWHAVRELEQEKISSPNWLHYTNELKRIASRLEVLARNANQDATLPGQGQGSLQDKQ